MSNYRRLISYIYAYEGEVKGKNIGYAKIEIRNGQCRIQVNVKKVFLGGSDIGVYLLCPQEKIQIGRIFIRNGSGEFRANVNATNVENSGYSIESCYGLSIYEQDNSWRRYTTIWEDAVVQAAEIQLAEVTAENVKAQSPSAPKPHISISKEIEQELQKEEQKREDSVPWEEPEPNEKEPEIIEIIDKSEEEKTMENSPEIQIEQSEEENSPIEENPVPESPHMEIPKSNTSIPEILTEKNPIIKILMKEPVVNEIAAEESTPKEQSKETPSVKEKPMVDSKPQPPEPGDPERLKELERLEQIENLQSKVWNRLQRRYPKVLAFDYANGCEILSIKPQDIGILPRENWVYGNNSFLLHGYYNYRHLILAKLNNPEGEPRYLLGVPGHYFSNEKHMASMFGFPNFVLAKKQPEEDGRFGYWYTDLRL